MSLGATLRQARAARQLSIDALARATRIPPHTLVAMEEDDWKRIPRGIFARGYLRAVAREIGLDGAALAAQYDAEQAPPPPPTAEAAAGQSERDAAVFRVRFPALPEAARRWVAGSAMLALLFFVYLVGRWSALDERPDTAAPAAADSAAPATTLGTRAVPTVGTSAAAADAPAPLGAREAASAGPQATAARPAPGPDAPLLLDVSVTRPCWVEASSDGERAIYRLLQPGDRVQTRGRIVTLHVGDAGALQLSVDGGPTRTLGGNGQVVTVRITRENYRSLLPAPAGD